MNLLVLLAAFQQSVGRVPAVDAKGSCCTETVSIKTSGSGTNLLLVLDLSRQGIWFCSMVPCSYFLVF